MSRRAAPSVIDNVPVIQSDYTFTSLVNAFQGQDAVICAIAADNIEVQYKIIDAAVAAKVKRFIPDEFGIDTSPRKSGEMDTFFKTKQNVAAYLQQKEAEGLSWTALCTGIWIDWVSIFFSATPLRSADWG